MIKCNYKHFKDDFVVEFVYIITEQANYIYFNAITIDGDNFQIDLYHFGIFVCPLT